ncbi:MAG: DUF6531 domain-containing protein [Solimonas sp.]
MRKVLVSLCAVISLGLTHVALADDPGPDETVVVTAPPAPPPPSSFETIGQQNIAEVVVTAKRYIFPQISDAGTVGSEDCAKQAASFVPNLQPNAGDPVDILSRLEVLPQVDFSAASEDEVPLVLHRYYNSGGIVLSDYSFAANWSSDVDERIFIVTSPDGCSESEVCVQHNGVWKVVWKTADGGSYTYLWSTTLGRWNDKKPQSLDRLTQETTGEWTLSTSENVTLVRPEFPRQSVAG